MSWTYPIKATFEEKKKLFSYRTQLYPSGVYIILNNDPHLDDTLTPQNMINLKRMLLRKQSLGMIINLEFGREITVIKDKDGCYIEVR